MDGHVETAFQLHGRSLIAGIFTTDGGDAFQGRSPADGSKLDPVYLSATLQDVESAAAHAAEAAPSLAASSGADRGRLLRHIADGLDQAAEALIERAQQETALARPRLIGEVARTSNQLRHFAGVVEEGSWVMARIDTADSTCTPPRPDIRSMLRPLGPVAVFGASNFPLAFSVAGGDTASALAAGNPVIVKAHPAHPGTSELAGQIITKSVKECGFPAGTFSLLFDAGHSIGTALVQDPRIRAVGFTGSLRGGRALMDLAAARHVPIPVYAEMGSSNPVFILPGAFEQSGEQLAASLHNSFTLSGGQMCTKPGLVFVPESPTNTFYTKIRAVTSEGPAFTLLTSGIASLYSEQVSGRAHIQTAASISVDGGFGAQTTLLETTFADFEADPSLSKEVFGPTTLLIQCTSTEQMLQAAQSLEGHLTASIFGTEEDLMKHVDLLHILETKAGRLIFNAFPTGVAVCHAMIHGGPYPATSDGRSTSVGSQAIFRFARPVCYQGLPQAALPIELRDENTQGILRLRNGSWTGLKS
jgi:alpha-ketoglutaric semialdehyde dehydrogenase